MRSNVSAAARSADTGLVQPDIIIRDGSLSKAQSDAQILAARRYDTLWNSGNEALVHAALAPDFTDRTVPPGRKQGIAGPPEGSRLMRAAIPDMTCDIEQMIVAGEPVVTHLHFRGHFTGHFKQKLGDSRPIDFIATDIYRVADGRITDNWHLEDNLTLLLQLGVIAQ